MNEYYEKSLDNYSKALQLLTEVVRDLNKELSKLKKEIKGLKKFNLANSSITICYDSKKDLYRAYYHGKAIFRSKDIEKLKKKIRNWDIEFKQWYKEGNIF